MRTSSNPRGKAMYMASQLDKSWLLNVQRKLYLRSWENPDYVFRELWGIVTDPHNLRCAFERVVRNRGARSAGVDRVTVAKVIARGSESFIEALRVELRSRAFHPSPVRRVMIPKQGKLGEYRPLGIPTIKDRVVQAAMKNILEPVFEADFYPCSYGFRPGRGVHGALEQVRKHLMPPPKPRPPTEHQCAYQYAIEGDIKGCFDSIGHHGLMNRIRRRIGDTKVNRLIVAFLKAGVLSEGQLLRSETGSPQGGILSPLLANIALSVIDERYERFVWPRKSPTLLSDRGALVQRAANYRGRDRRLGLTVLAPVRYADDFIILVSVARGPDELERARNAALAEKEALARVLKDSLGLELSEAKTLITPVTKPIRFLGHHVRLQRHRYYGWLSNAVIPKDRSQRLREGIKEIFRKKTCLLTLESRLKQVNALLRGWGHFYRFARGAKQVFAWLDHYVWWVVKRWLQKKYPQTSMRWLYARYGWRKPGRRTIKWRDGSTRLFELSSLRVERFRHRWMRPPGFAVTSMESPVRNERRTPGSEEGPPKTAG